MVYLYCVKPDPYVRLLAAKLGATLLRRFDGMHLWLKRDRVDLLPGDDVICWGATLPEFPGVRVLNNQMTPRHKFERLHELRNRGGITALAIILNNVGDPKKLSGQGYLPRSLSASHGLDLLDEDLKRSPIWTKRETLDNEHSIHVFRGKVVLTGLRVVAPGWAQIDGPWRPGEGVAHPWIRTAPLGWTHEYHEGVLPGPVVEAVVHKVINHFNLDFGVVGMSMSHWANIVTDVDLRPDLSNEIVMELYTRLLREWVGGQ